MPRFVSPNALATLNQRTGNQPVTVVGINWGLDIQWYSDKTLIIDAGIRCQPKLSTVSGVSCVKRNDNLVNSTSASVKLFDEDGSLKFALDNTEAEKKPAAIFQHFEGNSVLDMILLIYGRITGPVSWNEGSREVTFEITSELESDEVGYSALETDFNDLSPEAYGIPWPLIFGTVRHSPCVQVRKHSEVILAHGIKLTSIGYATRKNKDNKDVVTLNVPCHVINVDTQEEDILYFERTEFVPFPSNKPIKIVIDGVVFSGRYIESGTGDDLIQKFKVEQANVPLYENLKLGPRDSSDLSEKLRNKAKKNTSDEFSGYNHCWLLNATKTISQKLCFFKISGPYEWYAYCVAQYGTYCQFKKIVRSPQNNVPFLLTENNTVEQVYSIERNGMIPGVLDEVYELMYYHDPKMSGKIRGMLDKLKQSDSAFWSRVSGTTVRLWEQNDVDVYIASAVPLDTIERVYGRRKKKLENGKEIKVFAPIPSNYYTIQLQSNFKVHGAFASGLIFETPLTDRDDNAWDNAVYVTAKSTIGPNTSDIIKYLLVTYSQYNIDSSSFNQVATKIDDTPSNFAMFDRGDVLEVCRDIAWQARCALIVENQTVSIVYLGEAGFPVMSISEGLIEAKSVTFEWSEISQVYTKLIGSWTPSYQDEPTPTRHHERRRSVIREVIRALTQDDRATHNASRVTVFENNIDKYGVRPLEKRFYIYNDELYVKKSLSFWGNRLSNIWRKVSLSLMLPGMILKEFDTASIVFNTGIITPMNGIVESWNFDPKNMDIKVTFWLPSIAGTNFQSNNAYQ